MNEACTSKPKMKLPKGLQSLIDALDVWGPWEVGIEVTQLRIDFFAAATEDRQRIHVDSAWAKDHSPHGTTVAHGLLALPCALSGHPIYVEMCSETEGVKTTFIALNAVRFRGFVKSGSTLVSRMRVVDSTITSRRALLTAECEWAVTGREEMPVGSASFRLMCEPCLPMSVEITEEPTLDGGLPSGHKLVENHDITY